MQRQYTQNQISAIDTDGSDICVAAGAGSGKTGVLVERYVRLIAQSRSGALPPHLRAGVEQVLVITFTEKATREMKTRIVEALMRLGMTEERRQVETAYISTIHGFCSRLLQENPFEVGIDPHFSVLEEPQARRMLRQTVEAVVAEAYAAGDEETMELAAGVQGLRQHGEEQADPVASLAESVESLIARLRAAGRRREELEAHWRLGVEATAVAAEAFVWDLLGPAVMEIRACAAGLQALHASLLGMARGACDAILACSAAVRTGDPAQQVVQGMRALSEMLRKMRTRVSGATEAEMQFAQYVGRLKTAVDSRDLLFAAELPDPTKSALACHRMWGLTAAVWRAYDAAKRKAGRLDNDDLQAECVRLLEEFPHVLERYRKRLRYLMVDEFQDTNPLQMRLIELLHVKHSPSAPSDPPRVETDTTTAGTPAGEDRSFGVGGNGAEFRPLAQSAAAAPNFLFVVGDVQQSIYGFRGAEPALFRALEREFREEGAGEHVPLAINFRSRPEILGLIATLFRQIWREDETPFVPLEAGAGFDAVPDPSVELLLSQDLMRQDYLGLEPAALAQRVRQLVEGEELRLSSHSDGRRGEPVRYRDVAILLRQLTDIQKYEEAFTRAGVPYFVVGGGRGYYARQEIRDLLNILTVLDTPLDDVALLAALRSPMVGVEVDTLYRIVEFAADFTPTNDGVKSVHLPVEPASGSTGVNSPSNASIAPGAAARRKGPLPLYIALQRILETDAVPQEERARLALFVDTMDSLRPQEDRMPVGHLMERLISRTSYDARLLCRPNGRRRLANVRKLLQMANADPVLGVRDFIRRLRDMEKLSDREGDAPTEEEAADVVRFHTIHGAKGLEFPVVILADLCRPLDHPERGLFVCDPHTLALGTRVGGAQDAAYRAMDHRRREADQKEAERLLYVAMTRARERLILCGNLGRARGANWGTYLFPALGIIEMPPQPVNQTLIGGLVARLAPLAHYVHTSVVGGTDAAGHESERELARYSDRLAEALLAGEPVESVPVS